MGLELITSRSWVTCSTEWVSQVPPTWNNLRWLVFETGKRNTSPPLQKIHHWSWVLCKMIPRSMRSYDSGRNISISWCFIVLLLISEQSKMINPSLVFHIWWTWKKATLKKNTEQETGAQRWNGWSERIYWEFMRDILSVLPHLRYYGAGKSYGRQTPSLLVTECHKRNHYRLWNCL